MEQIVTTRKMREYQLYGTYNSYLTVDKVSVKHDRETPPYTYYQLSICSGCGEYSKTNISTERVLKHAEYKASILSGIINTYALNLPEKLESLV